MPALSLPLPALRVTAFGPAHSLFSCCISRHLRGFHLTDDPRSKNHPLVVFATGLAVAETVVMLAVAGDSPVTAR
jgi:hypothetical protein